MKRAGGRGGFAVISEVLREESKECREFPQIPSTSADCTAIEFRKFERRAATAKVAATGRKSSAAFKYYSAVFPMQSISRYLEGSNLQTRPEVFPPSARI